MRFEDAKEKCCRAMPNRKLWFGEYRNGGRRLVCDGKNGPIIAEADNWAEMVTKIHAIAKEQRERQKERRRKEREQKNEQKRIAAEAKKLGKVGKRKVVSELRKMCPTAERIHVREYTDTAKPFCSFRVDFPGNLMAEATGDTFAELLVQLRERNLLADAEAAGTFHRDMEDRLNNGIGRISR